MTPAEIAAMEDMFGITCMECGQSITDDTPWGEAPDGPVHLACAEDEVAS